METSLRTKAWTKRKKKARFARYHRVKSELSAKARTPDPRLPRLAALLAPICWATGAPIARAMLESTHPLPSSAFVAARFAISTMFLAPAFVSDVRKGNEGRNDTDGILPAALELGFYLFLGNAFVIESLRQCGAGHAEFVVNAAKAAIVPSLASFSGARVSKVTWAGAGGVMAGLALLTGGHGGDGPSLADAGLLMAALCFSAHTQRMSVHAAKFDALPLTFIKLSLVAVMAVVVSLVHGDLYSLSGALTSKDTILLLFLSGSISIAGGMTFQAMAQRSVGAAESQVIYATQPVWAAFYAWGALGETMKGQEILGGIVILLSSALSVLLERRGENG